LNLKGVERNIKKESQLSKVKLCSNFSAGRVPSVSVRRGCIERIRVRQSGVDECLEAVEQKIQEESGLSKVKLHRTAVDKSKITLEKSIKVLLDVFL